MPLSATLIVISLLMLALLITISHAARPITHHKARRPRLTRAARRDLERFAAANAGASA